jgi:hypothetical protein
MSRNRLAGFPPKINRTIRRYSNAKTSEFIDNLARLLTAAQSKGDERPVERLGDVFSTLDAHTPTRTDDCSLDVYDSAQVRIGNGVIDCKARLASWIVGGVVRHRSPNTRVDRKLLTRFVREPKGRVHQRNAVTEDIASEHVSEVASRE